MLQEVSTDRSVERIVEDMVLQVVGTICVQSSPTREEKEHTIQQQATRRRKYLPKGYTKGDRYEPFHVLVEEYQRITW